MMGINAPHMHLLLNHIPTTGFAMAMAFFLAGIIWKSVNLQRLSLVVFFLVALLTIPTYVSGMAADQSLQNVGGISPALIQAHEDAVLIPVVLMVLTGFVAWLGLWQFRITSRLPRWNLGLVFVLALVSFGLMAKAADLGGLIRHPEIQAAEDAARNPTTVDPHGLTQSLSDYMANHTWVRPATETIHFVGLCMLFAVVLLVDLRFLGMAKSFSYSALYQLLPLGIIGFGLNFFTGMWFFIGTPFDFMKNSVFFWKIGLIVLAGINTLYFTLLDEPWSIGSGDDAPFTAKAVAVSALGLWAAVLYLGHMLPFLGHAF